MREELRKSHFFFWIAEFIFGSAVYSKLGLSQSKTKNQKDIINSFLEKPEAYTRAKLERRHLLKWYEEK